jgi:phage terminase large subunit-like protein
MEALHVNRGQLVEERKNRDAVHDRGFEEKFFAARRGQVSELAVSVDDGAFVGGDGVGSVVEGGADVVDGGLAGFDVEGCSFEEDVGLGFR